MTEPAVALCLDVFDIDRAARWWGALAGYEIVERTGPIIGGTASLRSPRVPELELRFFACRPRPVTGCLIGSIRMITLRLDDPEAAVASLAKAIAPEPVIEVERTEGGAIILRDSHGYHVCVEAHRPAGSACAAASLP